MKQLFVAQRFHKNSPDRTAVIALCSYDEVAPVVLWSRFVDSVTEWVATTFEGAACWNDAGHNANINDLLRCGALSSPSFEDCYRKHSLTSVECIELPDQALQDYDDCLVDEQLLNAIHLERCRALKPGDTVKWTDPDNATCSREDVVKAVDVPAEDGDINFVSITWPDDSMVEAYIDELTIVTIAPPPPPPAEDVDREDVVRRLSLAVVDQMGLDDGILKPEDEFVKDLGADSLDKIELIMAAEEEFNIQIEDEEAEDIKTFGQAVDLIVKILGTPGRA